MLNLIDNMTLRKAIRTARNHTEEMKPNKIETFNDIQLNATIIESSSKMELISE